MRHPRNDSVTAPTRTCILGREQATRGELIRLAWIGVTRAELIAAAGPKGKLRGALARAFKTNDFTIPDDLADRVAAALERNALDRLGLESRAGTLLTGAERIEAAAREGKLHALYHAADAGADGRGKLAWRVGTDREGSDLKGLALPLNRPILSMALGRENVVHIGVTDRMAAARLGEALDRWLQFIGPELTPVPCETASQGASPPGQSGQPAVTTRRGI